MTKKVQSLFASVQNLERIRVRVKQQQHQAMRTRIDDVVRRVEAAKERERQARLERKVVDDFGKRRQAQLKEEQ